MISDIDPPQISLTKDIEITPKKVDSTLTTFKNNWLHKNKFQLYEMYVSGDGFERGMAFGKMGKELVREQELAFTNEIQRMIPSKRYLKFLKYIVGFMNRDLADYVIKEYQDEIYGTSLAASEEFNWIGTKYSRQLNYHAAHDIGHALANMMLVGCSSFATWDEKSKDSNLLIGRNFDFYVGDEFAKNKIVAFYKPKQGHAFMSLTWPGFSGVVSGMNTEGLTVTINANKSDIPFGAATPVSLVAREILQYASTIQEAYAIASKRKMFVSESFLIGSAKDHKAVVIEKTPDTIDIYESKTSSIICTNHYQGKILGPQELNEKQKQNSASVYRHQRLTELLNGVSNNTPEQSAAILRDYKGIGNNDIGYTNEKSMNQFLAHHSIIFQPEKLLVWVSTSPWQEGSYLCYDLNKIFSNQTPNFKLPLYDTTHTIAADRFLQSDEFKKVQRYLFIENELKLHHAFDPQEVISINPNYYDAYRIAGDEYLRKRKYKDAKQMYSKALTLEIATVEERNQLIEKIKHINSLH